MNRQRWILWIAFLLFWTTLLVYPYPDPILEPTERWLTVTRRFLLAKIGHVLGYTFLSWLSGRLNVPLAYRPLLMFGLMAHAIVTEMIQLRFAQRGGSLYDAGLNAFGILLGFVIGRKAWLRKE